MSQPRVTRSVLAHCTITTTHYPCPCGRGEITVKDGYLHATRHTPEEDMDQQVFGCDRCGNEDVDAAAEALAQQED